MRFPPVPDSNVFSDKSKMAPRPPSTLPPFDMSTPDSILVSAKSFLSSDLGIANPSALADDFLWIGPNVMYTGALNKEEYIAAGKYFNLRGAFPDLDYRAHDFRIIDSKQDGEINTSLVTVRLTARTVGTMRGRLRLRGETIEPNLKRMICPPEAISITFNTKTGKVVKLISGFCMDRLVGNTGGLCGVQAAATIAGSPPSEWELYPPLTVLGRFFGRSVKQVQEPDDVFLAPFPETVMIQLAKGVLASNLGTNDPDLLSDKFTFCGPLLGPLDTHVDKATFLETFGNLNISEAIPDLKENFTNFRVDPYNPYRIWYDVQATGTRTGSLSGKEGNGAKYDGPPEAASLTFDDEGFCTRMTAGAVMDPTIGNTGGFGGVYGIFYATGIPLPFVASRTIPEIISKAKLDFLSPFMGTKADGTVKVRKANSKTELSVLPSVPSAQSTSPSNIAPKPPQALPSAYKITANDLPSDVPNVSIKLTPSQEKKSVLKKIPLVKNIPVVPKELSNDKPLNSLFRFLKDKVKTSTQDVSRPTLTTKQSSGFNKGTIETKKVARSSNFFSKTEKLQTLENINKSKTSVLSARNRNIDKNQKKPASLKPPDLIRRVQEKKIKTVDVENKLSTFNGDATSISSIKELKKTTPNDIQVEAITLKTPRKAPKGVPEIRSYKKNIDGSITGIISGSKKFQDGEKITTSKLAAGQKLESGSTVQTVTGSKYFIV